MEERKDEKGHCVRFEGEKRLNEKTKMRRTMEGVDQRVPLAGDDGGNVADDVGSGFGEAAMLRKEFTTEGCAENGEFFIEGVAGAGCNILENRLDVGMDWCCGEKPDSCCCP